MPQPIPYNDFLANVNAADFGMMTTFIVGIEVNAANPAEADALFAQAQRLYGAGMLDSLDRRYKDVGGALHQSFRGVVSPVGAGYVGRLARERIVLSRAPLPE